MAPLLLVHRFDAVLVHIAEEEQGKKECGKLGNEEGIPERIKTEETTKQVGCGQKKDQLPGEGDDHRIIPVAHPLKER